MASKWSALAAAVAPPDDVFDRLGYVPTPKQQIFHAAKEFDVLYGGAMGGGKTKALLMDDLRDAMLYPGIRILALRRTYDELAESFFKELILINYASDLGAKWLKQDRELTFPNGSVIRYRYADDLVDATRRQGGEYQKVTIDERTLMDPEVVELIKERIRSGQRTIPVIGIRSSSNPGGIGHGYCKLRFIDNTAMGTKTYIDASKKEVRYIPAKATDNPHLNEDYLDLIDAIPDVNRRKAMRDGDWTVFKGQFFQEWNPELHAGWTFPVPEYGMEYRGIDYGYAAPWCVLYASLDGDGRLWVFSEIYARGVGEAEQAMMARQRHIERNGSAIWHADPSMWAKTSDADPIADTYQRLGVPLERANNDRVIGWQRVRTYLADYPACRHHRAQGFDQCPRVHIHPVCENLIRTLPNLPYDPRKTEDLDTKAEDHAADALRYLVMAVDLGPQFHFGKASSPTTAPDGTILAEEFGRYARLPESENPWVG